MIFRICLTIALAFLLSSASAQEPEAIRGQYIVILKEIVAKPVIKQQKKNNNRAQKERENKDMRDENLLKVREVRRKKNISESTVISSFADVLLGFSAKLSDEAVISLKSDPDVQGVYQDYKIMLGPVLSEAAPPEINEVAQTITCAVNKAGGPVDGASKSNWIWILDTGIDLDHPDLNVQTNPLYAVSFIAGQAADDGHGHGTHCAGIAAAKNNNIGGAGVSAGAMVVPVKVLDNSGSGSWSALIEGLDHVAKFDNPGDVVSMSLGGYGYNNCENSNPSVRDAIRNLGSAGTFICMASGNDGKDAAKNFPGCINAINVYTIASIDCSNNCSGFSNLSGQVVDWVAVGQSVYSTYKNGGYATLSGTSMATPVVAGIIHSRNSPPTNGGTLKCKGTSYKIAVR